MSSQDPLPDADVFKNARRVLKRALKRAVLSIVSPYFCDCDVVIKMRSGKEPYIEIIDRDTFEAGAAI